MSDTEGSTVQSYAERRVEHAKGLGDLVLTSGHNCDADRLTYLVTQRGWVDIVRGLGTAKEAYLCGMAPDEFARIAEVSAQQLDTLQRADR
jgi:hypothetical protein